MIRLRDSLGEIETGAGDLFQFKAATMSVIYQDPKQSSVIWVRLYKGILEWDGKRFEIEEGVRPPCFPFTAELVAGCIRAQKPKLAPEFEAIPSYQDPLPQQKVSKVRKGSKPSKIEDQATLF